MYCGGQGRRGEGELGCLTKWQIEERGGKEGRQGWTEGVLCMLNTRHPRFTRFPPSPSPLPFSQAPLTPPLPFLPFPQAGLLSILNGAVNPPALPPPTLPPHSPQAGLLSILNGAVTAASEVWLFSRVPIEAREWLLEKVRGFGVQGSP